MNRLLRALPLALFVGLNASSVFAEATLAAVAMVGEWTVYELHDGDLRFAMRDAPGGKHRCRIRALLAQRSR